MVHVSVSLSAADFNHGIASLDSYSGEGYIMYSASDFRSRFDAHAKQSASFATVIYDSTAEQWYYLTNDAKWPFEPRLGDVLVASVNFKTDRVTLLDTEITEVGGLTAGYVSSDLKITPNRWDGESNSGEFGVSGTYLNLDLPTQTYDLSATDLGKGIVGLDGYQGTGYIMYSGLDVRDRFDIRADQSARFVSVIYDEEDGQWYYLADKTKVAFSPVSTDVIIAEVDFTQDTATLIEIDTTQAVTQVHGVRAGVANHDLTIKTNQWDGDYNFGEFQVMGTSFDTAALPVEKEPQLHELGGDRHSIAATDDRDGTGFILHSQESLHHRFEDHPSYGDAHFVAVIHQDGQWYYDTNTGLVAFDPTDSDTLVAEVDFTDNTVRDLSGINSRHHGIDMGYADGNLTFYAEYWAGSRNVGEFQINGDWFATEEHNFEFKDAATFASRTTLPDGAIGSTDGKGWTSTGLFHDNGTFWSGNDGRTGHRDKTHEPSVIRMNLEGTEILEQIDVHALEAEANVSWNIKTIQGIVVDHNGDLWVASSTSDRIFKIVATTDDQGHTSYALDTDADFKVTDGNGLAFNPTTQELSVYSTRSGYVYIYDISTGKADYDRKFNMDTGGDQLYYNAEENQLWVSAGGNGKSAYIKIFDYDTGDKIGQSSHFHEVTAAEGISVVDDQLFFQSDAYFHPEGEVDLNQLIVYDLDPDLNGTIHLETETTSDFWF